MSDELIIKLVGSINGEHFPVQDLRPDGHRILVVDPLYYLQKTYRLIMTFHPDQDYLGVINAYRRRKK